MLEYVKTWAELKYDRRAVTALEYALVAAALGAVVIAAFAGVGSQLAAKLKTAIG